jgi:hypothetical protein
LAFIKQREAIQMHAKSTTLFTLAAASAGLVGALAGGAASAVASTAQLTAQVSANTAAKLPDGLYVDAPDGFPHYVLSLGASGHDDIKGSVNFIYQDGRVDFTGIYKGELSGKGKLSIRFYKGTISHGKIVLHGRGTVLTGTYQKDSLHLNGCASVLPWVDKIHLGCTFTYHGYTP